MAEIIEEYHPSKAVDAALVSGEKLVKVSLVRYELEFC